MEFNRSSTCCWWLPFSNPFDTLTAMTDPPIDPHLPELMSVTEVSKLLNMTRQGVLKAANNGQLRGRKAGATWVFRKAVVLRYVEKHPPKEPE